MPDRLRARPVAARVEHRAGSRCSCPGIALAALGTILFLAGHPKAAGRFEGNENWTRFIGAVHEGIVHLRGDRRQVAGVLGTAFVYQVSVIATVGFLSLTLGTGVSVRRARRVHPRGRDGPGRADLARRASGSVRACSSLLLTPLGVSNGHAVGLGLAWYATMLLVSLPGAPAFAVGNRRRRRTTHDRRRRRSSERTDRRTRRRRAWHRRLRGGKTLTGGAVIYWWLEIIAVLTYYLVYSAVRNADAAHPERAYQHAKQLIGWQKTLGIYHELAIHKWARNIEPLDRRPPTTSTDRSTSS